MLKKIKIGLADDQEIFRNSLTSILDDEEQLELIWAVENGQMVLERVKISTPDVILLDIEMPVLDGILTAKSLNKDFPGVKLIFVSMHKEPNLIDIMKNYGVSGYVVKDSLMDDLVECINDVSVGKSFISPEISKMLKNLY